MRGKYVVVSGIFFGLIAIVQAIRAFNQWPIQVASLQIPVWFSWVAAAVAASLCLWAFRSKG
jgi:hypothetical protein